MRKFSFDKISKILLIESNKEDADTLFNIVSSDFEVISTYDGTDALAILLNGQNTFSTIIVDIKNALSILRTIRKNPILKSGQIV